MHLLFKGLVSKQLELLKYLPLIERFSVSPFASLEEENESAEWDHKKAVCFLFLFYENEHNLTPNDDVPQNEQTVNALSNVFEG